MAKRRGRQGTPATVALTRAGIVYRVHAYEREAAASSYGIEAAEALSVAYERVFKTLVVEVDGALIVAVVPVDRQLDLKALAIATGGKRATMAEVATAERVTGYVAGGISPLGQRRSLPTVVDVSALEHGSVYVSGGRRGLDVELSPADLVRLTRAITAPITRRGGDPRPAG